jgi:hypothetical protein
MEQEKIYGKLFNSVPLLTENHLQTLLDVMDREQAIFLIVQAVKHAYHNGIYSLGESEIISKSIRVLSENKNGED